MHIPSLPISSARDGDDADADATTAPDFLTARSVLDRKEFVEDALRIMVAFPEAPANGLKDGAIPSAS